MNNSRAIFGVILAAAAATLHHVLWSRPPSSPHPIEAPQAAASLTQQASMAQEFADLPRSIHTVPVVRQAAPAAPEPEQSTQAPLRALPLSRLFPQHCHHPLNPSMCAHAMATIASTSCAAIMRCGVASIRGIGK
jgi:hypothetical protein